MEETQKDSLLNPFKHAQTPTVEAHLFNAWGKKLDEQLLPSVRAVMLTPFSSWAYVIFRSAKTGTILEVFTR